MGSIFKLYIGIMEVRDNFFLFVVYDVAGGRYVLRRADTDIRVRH